MRGLLAGGLGLGALGLWCVTSALAAEGPVLTSPMTPAPSLRSSGVTLGKPALPGTMGGLQAEATGLGRPALTVRAQAPEPDPPQPPAFLDLRTAVKSDQGPPAAAQNSDKGWLEALLTEIAGRSASAAGRHAANQTAPPNLLPAAIADPRASGPGVEPVATPASAEQVVCRQPAPSPFASDPESAPASGGAVLASEGAPEFLPDAVAAASCSFWSTPTLGYGGFYASAEYLHWWISGYDVPALVTTNRAGNLAAIGNPGTVVLFGDRELHDDDRSGGRLTLGLWLDCDQSCGLEISGFYFPEDTEGFSANSGQFPILGRPFFNLNAGQEDVQTIAFPGLATGGLIVEAPSKFWGVEANARKNLICGCDFLVDVLAGVRYLELSEGLGVTELVVVEPGVPIFGGQTASVFDRFDTRNRFYGGQIGAVAEWRRDRWGVDLRAKLGLGVTHQEININGGQTVVGPSGGTTGFVGGLLALPTNIGHFSRDRFSVVPELGVTLRYQITTNLYASVGYNILYWSNVVRPGDQIDRVLDVTQIPNGPLGFQPTGQRRPAVLFRESDLWAHGISVGLELRY